MALIRHGTVLGYKLDGCRCEGCTRASVMYQSRLALRRMRGQIWADLSAVRRAVSEFIDAGVSTNALAVAAGSSPGTAAKIVSGEGNVRSEVGEKFKQLTWDDFPDSGKVSMDPVREIVDLLLDKGWSRYRIGREVLGYTSWPGDHWIEQECVTLGVLRRVRGAVRCWECHSEDPWAGGQFCESCSPAAGRAA